MQVFVIMPFKREFDILFKDCIVPACTKMNLEAIRADKILEPGSIPEQIFNAIKDSLFIIGEISQTNDNVFYELGYSQALDKKAILLSSVKRQLPFDIRVTRTIFYNIKEKKWKLKLLNDLINTIEHLYSFSEKLILNNLKVGQELKGHMHTISGHLLTLETFQHFWFFAKREDLDTWWPQDNGEVTIKRDGTWNAQLFLGVEDRKEDINQFYDLKFGFIDTKDNRELTEFCIRCIDRNFFPGIRQLPRSFDELAHIKLKRV